MHGPPSYIVNEVKISTLAKIVNGQIKPALPRACTFRVLPPALFLVTPELDYVYFLYLTGVLCVIARTIKVL
jgi:hypothetical protein